MIKEEVMFTIFGVCIAVSFCFLVFTIRGCDAHKEGFKNNYCQTVVDKKVLWTKCIDTTRRIK